MSRSFSSFEPKYDFKYGVPGEEGISVSNLDISFVIDSGNSNSEQHSYRVDIFNLNKETTASMISEKKKPGAVFILSVGYQEDKLLTTIASSTVSTIEAIKKETELVTRIFGTGGYEPFKQSTTFRNFPENTTGLQVLNSITTDLRAAGLEARVDLDPQIQNQLNNIIYANGYRTCALSKDSLTELLVSNGLYYKVESGKMSVHRIASTTTNTETFIEINENSGLIDSPQLSTPHPEARSRDKLPADSINFKVLLDPRLKVDGFVKVESEFVNGFYRLARVVHRGQTRGSEWITQCDAEVMNGS